MFLRYTNTPISLCTGQTHSKTIITKFFFKKEKGTTLTNTNSMANAFSVHKRRTLELCFSTSIRWIWRALNSVVESKTSKCNGRTVCRAAVLALLSQTKKINNNNTKSNLTVHHLWKRYVKRARFPHGTVSINWREKSA